MTDPTAELTLPRPSLTLAEDRGRPEDSKASTRKQKQRDRRRSRRQARQIMRDWVASQ